MPTTQTMMTIGHCVPSANTDNRNDAPAIANPWITPKTEEAVPAVWVKGVRAAAMVCGDPSANANRKKNMGMVIQTAETTPATERLEEGGARGRRHDRRGEKHSLNAGADNDPAGNQAPNDRAGKHDPNSHGVSFRALTEEGDVDRRRRGDEGDQAHGKTCS